MQVLRTPDARFDNLPDYPFGPNYLTVTDRQDGNALRLHYLDEGPRDAAPILLMHGEPSWSYLYRKFVPPLVADGYRVVAPDLIGFGKSDKPVERLDYTYERHVEWMSEWLLSLDLNNITLFCQDWGGLIGLRLVAAFPERFARLIIGNTGLPIGTGWSEGFENWRNFSQNVPVFPTGFILNGGSVRELSADEQAAYDAPFPDESYKGGARQFPVLVPIKPDMPSVAENKAAWAALEGFEKPVVTCFSDQDAVTKGGEQILSTGFRARRGSRTGSSRTLDTSYRKTSLTNWSR
jgi:haloalkane dehalogenase